MDDFLIRNRMNLPITTGGATAAQRTGQDTQTAQQTAQQSFRQTLERMAGGEGTEISFSKHAAGRIQQREIDLSAEGLQKLTQGMEIARDKGIQDALILMDGSAFIVSAKNSTVITALNSSELKQKVITNIDGTVIL